MEAIATINVTINEQAPSFYCADAWAMISQMGLQPGDWSPLPDEITELLCEFAFTFYEYDWFVEFKNGVYNLYTQN